MDVTQRCIGLQKRISVYDTESFAGFFAYFLRQGIPGSGKTMDDFGSKLKDLMYLVALNAFSKEKGTQRFELNDKLLRELASEVAAIKKSYHPEDISGYTLESVLHQMVFENHFHNGTLSYVEQDLEKIRRVFSPFEEAIEQHFGFNVDDAIEMYKHTELNFKIRFESMMAYARTEAFQKFLYKVNNKKCSFKEAFGQLPQYVQDGFLEFYDKTYAAFLFTKADLCHLFEETKVGNFVDAFSCEPAEKDFLYFTDCNPLDAAPFLKLGDDRYLHICQKLTAGAISNKFYQFLLASDLYFDKVRKHREKTLEKKVAGVFRNFFSKNGSFYENYFVVDGHEQDLLILSKNFAFIIETKASKIREPMRNVEKAMVKIRDDFDDSVQYAYTQCKRVEDLFWQDDPFDIKDEKGRVLYTVDPMNYQQVFSITVTLERLGCLQTDLALLLQKEEEVEYPWSVYIDDLETFLMALKKISKNHIGSLVSFLIEREKLHSRCYAIDEMDICAEFLIDPQQFTKNANRLDTFLTFSGKNQGFFDDMYRRGMLRFSEDTLPDPKRYFKDAPKNLHAVFS